MNTHTETPNTGDTRLPIQRILVPVDFSTHSGKALQYAARFSQAHQAAIYLIHVIEPVPALGGLEEVPLLKTAEQIEKTTRQYLERIKTQQLKGFNAADPIIRRGRAYVEIVQAAVDEQIDLIIMASRGYSGLKRAVMGSTTERVVHHAGCPVLVLPSA